MNSLTSCCANEGARQGITPYQRLPRSRSASSRSGTIPYVDFDVVSNADIHPSHNDFQLSNRCKTDASTHHNAGSLVCRYEHNIQTVQNCSPSSCINLQSHGEWRTACSVDEGPSPMLVPISAPFSRELRDLGSVSCYSNVYTSQIQQGRRLCIEPDHEDVNTVLIKIGIIGDSGTGKTSFMTKYGGVELKNDSKDVAMLQKICKLQHINIALHIWDLGGQWQYSTKMPMVCKDAATIFIMFDLTRRSTLQSVKKWYLCARECNKVAMFVLIGTKYDGFIQLPKELQLAITQEARIHAKKMKAPLFFSSVTYNINVHKVFKVVVARLFDLPCRVTQNFKIGEPIVLFQ